MKKILLLVSKSLTLLIFLVLAQNANSQWVSHYSGKGGDVSLQNAHGNDIKADNQGFCYITGTVNEGSSDNILIIKYNAATGDTAWVRSYDGPANGDDYGNKVAIDNYGNVYVAGAVSIPGKSFDIAVLKYDSNGNLLWHMTYESASNGEDVAQDLAVDGSGNVYTIGYVTNLSAKTEMMTLKYDTDGNLIWDKSFGIQNLDSRATSIAINHSGTSLYVIGYSSTLLGANDIALLRYDSDGNRTFAKVRYNIPNSEDRAFGIAVDNYDNVYISGYVTVSAGNTDCYTAKYGPMGNQYWERTFDGGFNLEDKAFGIAVDQDNSVYVVGYTTSLSSSRDYLLIAYNSDGTDRYVTKYNGPANGDDEAKAIGIVTNLDSTKSIIITGSSVGENVNNDYTTVWFDNVNGDQQESVRYSMNSATDDKAMSLAIDGSNETFVTGFSQLIGPTGPSASCVLSTVKYGTFTGTHFKKKASIPEDFRLYQNYPNPFNPSTVIKFTVPGNSNVKLCIYDVTGRIVSTLVNEFLKSGTYEMTFTTQDLASGVYFYSLTAGTYRDVRKMTLVK